MGGELQLPAGGLEGDEGNELHQTHKLLFEPEGDEGVCLAALEQYAELRHAVHGRPNLRQPRPPSNVVHFFSDSVHSVIGENKDALPELAGVVNTLTIGGKVNNCVGVGAEGGVEILVRSDAETIVVFGGEGQVLIVLRSSDDGGYILGFAEDEVAVRDEPRVGAEEVRDDLSLHGDDR